jgi:pimeloyl-ACP methyl ester carboxylesterase
LSGVRRQYVDGPFGQIHVRTVGPAAAAKRPVVCLHQSPKSGLEMQTLLGWLGEDRLAIAPDYPGYGESDPPPDERAATIEAYARASWAAIDALGHGAVDLFGNHTGAKVAAAMACAAPARVGAIAMVSAAVLTPAERATFEDYFQPIPLDEAGTRFTTMWARIRHHAGPGMSLEMMARSFMQNLLPGEAYEWGHAAAFAYGAAFEQALAQLQHRILIFNPADELQTATRRAGALMRNGAILERPDWGHGFLDLHARDVADILRRFFDDNA